ncbi:MAG: serine/threonine protein kinase [Desulfurococcales archaeon]|nr:serine/threonine protein kinase [Desulfurococcales archaeon]
MVEVVGRRVRELVGGKGVAAALEYARSVLEECMEHSPIIDCSYYKDLVSVLEQAGRDIGGVVRGVEEAYRRLSLGLLEELLGRAESVCRVLGVDAFDCRVLEKYRVFLESIRGFIEKGVVVEFPERTGSGWFRVLVKARNNTGILLRNVYIDFSPAKYYLEIENPRFELPPLYPGMDIGRSVRVKPLFNGLIIIPYRVCVGEYCVERSGRVSVGVWRGVGAGSPRVLEGRSIRDPVVYKLKPRMGKELSRVFEIGDYVCTHILGSGGFSVTLLCSRGSFNAVLKIPPEAYSFLLNTGSSRGIDAKTLGISDKSLKAFNREASVLKKLTHPNIVRLYGYYTLPFPYLVFEYCELGDLGRLLDAVDGVLSVKTALEIAIPIGLALATAHSLDEPIVHLDIKPGNILFTRDYIPKLIDFNTAKIIGSISRITSSRGFTPGYAAPEQLGALDQPPGPYSDVYGLAVVLYEMITGLKPYPAKAYKKMFKGEIEKPKPPSTLNKETPRELDEILAIALSINPNDRYRNAEEFTNDLWDIYQEYYL